MDWHLIWKRYPCCPENDYHLSNAPTFHLTQLAGQMAFSSCGVPQHLWNGSGQRFVQTFAVSPNHSDSQHHVTFVKQAGEQVSVGFLKMDVLKELDKMTHHPFRLEAECRAVLWEDTLDQWWKENRKSAISILTLLRYDSITSQTKDIKKGSSVAFCVFVHMSELSLARLWSESLIGSKNANVRFRYSFKLYLVLNCDFKVNVTKLIRSCNASMSKCTDLKRLPLKMT